MFQTFKGFIPVAVATLIILAWHNHVMAGPDGAIAVTIDTSTTFQTIRGWETSDRVWETDKKADRFDGSWISVADQLAKSLVAEVGINSLRLQIASGTENPVGNWQRFSDGTIGYKEMKSHLYETVNDNDDPALLDPAGFNFFALDQHVENVAIPMQTALAAQGERLFVTLTFVDFNWTDGATRLDFAKYPAEYAEFIFAAFQHLDQKYGLVPDALEVILEPENTDFWRGRTIGNAIVAATGRLAAAGYHPLIIAPSTKAAENAVDYYRDIRATLAGRAKIDVLAYHRYGSRTSAALPGIAAAAKATGVQTAMLEYTDGGVDDLLEDLVVGNVSAWQQYGVARKVVNGEPRASARWLSRTICPSTATP